MGGRESALLPNFSVLLGDNKPPTSDSKERSSLYNSSISIVTPTLNRAPEVTDLLSNLSRQTLLPLELILVDGAAAQVTDTEQVVKAQRPKLPYKCQYVRHGGGTAIQRNVGIDVAQGEFIAFIDDDIRLETDFFEQIMSVFEQDKDCKIGGVAGYITNQYFSLSSRSRWRWYKRLRLFTTYEPGRYDYQSGYPINRYMQFPHEGIRQIDFMGTNCAVWRRQVFDNLRFDNFFTGYGVLEDAHFALRARRSWELLECGSARCIHLHSPSGRSSHRAVARKTATNYRYVFLDIVDNRTWRHELRFWRVQFFDLLRITAYAVTHRKKENWQTALGKLEGIVAAVSIKRKDPDHT